MMTAMQFAEINDLFSQRKIAMKVEKDCEEILKIDADEYHKAKEATSVINHKIQRILDDVYRASDPVGEL